MSLKSANGKRVLEKEFYNGAITFRLPDAKYERLKQLAKVKILV